jgi:arsenate reductase
MTQRILFICTHNSARSQMAEGLLRHLGGRAFDVYSAGTEATIVRPFAIQVMAELDINISRQSSKILDRYLHERFDDVITVCDTAAEACPIFPNATHMRHWSFEDPSKAIGSQEEQLAVYRRVRDEIRARIEQELLNTNN